ncbi:MAG: LysM peptidoglycan-binding domain-containing protein [Chlamydiia bacterium]|nr:LysM peptidoglycan-binding domain-containing protein [Chlamydiia bacterium]
MKDRSHLLKQVQRLTLALIISGTVNITLITAGFWWFVKERPPSPYFDHRPASLLEQTSPLAIDHSNAEVLRFFSRLPYEQLVSKLKDNRLVENGYTQRDLALGVLFSQHHLDLQRALQGTPIPRDKRILAYGNKPHERVIVYPSLTAAHYDTIIDFVNTELWPLTPQGMFLTLKQKQPQTLKEAFYHTQEFQAVKRLFQRSDATVKKKDLLAMLIESNWQAVEQFATQQRKAQDLSDARRRNFLLSYIDSGSSTAALLLLQTDEEFATTKLDDDHVIAILKLTTKRTAPAAKYALKALTSPRSAPVWREAATRLYAFAGEQPPQPLDRQSALERFAPLVATAERKQKPMVKPPPEKISDTPKSAVQPWRRAYLVQEGDSLWKISRRFKVDIEELKRRNNLSTDTLQPDTLLSIP